MTRRRLRVAVLYPRVMNLYGDRGNVMALQARAAARAVDLAVDSIEIGDGWAPDETDIVLIGGGQDREQRRVQDDLHARSGALQDFRDADGVILAVCGGYQLFGQSYRDNRGDVLQGAGVFDMVSIHPGPRIQRCVGNVVALWEGDTLVGFENHGGRSYLNEGTIPLAEVVVGFGNNGGDGWEGARIRNAFGTYLHGALLPKNPRFADRLLQLALQRRYGENELVPLSDAAEMRAHAETLHRSLRGRR